MSQRRMVRAGLMEKIMSKTNDTWCCAAARSERELTADELEHVSGGTPKLLEAACKGQVFPPASPEPVTYAGWGHWELYPH
jgi:hypothetical protein